VSCGEGPQALALRLAAPAPTESVDAAVAAVVGDSPAVKAPPTARPARPTKEFAVQEAPKEAPRPITVRIGVVGISGDKLLDGAVSQAAVQRQTSMLEGCYRSWLRGSAALPKAVTVSFKADKAGLVEQASVRAVSSSGESALDTCAINTVRRSTMTGAKKAAEGRVKIQFESYQ
jgi:TonB family protein